MFEKIKNFISGFGYVWKYGDIIRNVTVAWSRFPGLGDSEELRLWVRPVITDASVLTTLTQTPLDDLIAAAAIRIVDNNHSWSAIFALAQLVHNGQRAVASHRVLPHRNNNPLPLVAKVDERSNAERRIEREANRDETARFPQSVGSDISIESIARDACPDCPAMGLTAIGLLLYLLQQRRV